MTYENISFLTLRLGLAIRGSICEDRRLALLVRACLLLILLEKIQQVQRELALNCML